MSSTDQGERRSGTRARSGRPRAIAVFALAFLPAIASAAASHSKNIRVVGQIGGATPSVTIADGFAYFGIGPRLAVGDLSNPGRSEPIGLSAPLPGRVVSIAVSGTKAYVAAGDSGLRVLDVSNPKRPVSVGANEFRGDASGVAVVGGHAYVSDRVNGLHVFDVSGPGDPVPVGFLEIEGVINHVAARDGYAFVSAGLKGVRVINVFDPAHPAEVAFLETPGFTEFVCLDGDRAYVADQSGGLRIVDLSDPTHPVAVGLFNTLGFGLGVAVMDNVAYIADGDEGVRVVDVADPRNPFEIGNSPTPGGPSLTSGVAAGEGLVYVADGDHGLRVLDVSDPSHPVPRGRVFVPGFAQDVAVVDNALLVANDTAGLWAIDATAIDSLHVRAFVKTESAFRVQVQGHRAFVPDGFSGLRIFDVTNSLDPKLIGTYDTPGFAFAVAVSGDRVYVADGDTGIVVVDVTDPVHPSTAGFFPTPAPAWCVTVASGHLYACAGVAGLRIADTTDPSHPVEVGVFETPDSFAQEVAVVGTRAYLVHPNKGLSVIDVSDPHAPTELGNIPLVQFAFDVGVRGHYAYVASGILGLRVVDVSDPAHMREVGFIDTPGNAWGVTLDATRVYLADQGGGVYILEFDEGNVGPTVGGGSFGLSLGPAPEMTWLGGTAQTAYILNRSSPESGISEFLPPGGVLPGFTISYRDDDVLTSPTYCYWLLALDPTGVVGASDFLCGRLNSRSGAVIAPGFTIRLNQSETATLFWEASGGQDAYVLMAIPSDGSETRVTLVDKDETHVDDDTKGIFTCYVLFSIRGGQYGNTDVLCAQPGRSR